MAGIFQGLGSRDSAVMTEKTGCNQLSHPMSCLRQRCIPKKGAPKAMRRANEVQASVSHLPAEPQSLPKMFPKATHEIEILSVRLKQINNSTSVMNV